MKNIIYLFVIALLLSGCGSTTFIPLDNGTYLMSRSKAQLFYGQPIGTRAVVYREANELCAKQNKKVETISCEMQNQVPFRPGNVSLKFRCVADNDSTLK